MNCELMINIYKRPIIARTFHFVCAECTDFSSLHTWTWWLHKWNHTRAKSRGSFSWHVNRLNPFWSFLHFIGLYGWIINMYFSSNMGSTPFMTHVMPLTSCLRDLTRFNVPPSSSQWMVACRLAVTFAVIEIRFRFCGKGGDVNMIPYSIWYSTGSEFASIRSSDVNRDEGAPLSKSFGQGLSGWWSETSLLRWQRSWKQQQESRIGGVCTLLKLWTTDVGLRD